MHNLIETQNRFETLFSSQSDLIQINQILIDTLHQDSTFFLKSLLLFFSDKPNPSLHNYLGSALKYLLKMSWNSISSKIKHFSASLSLFCISHNILIPFDYACQILKTLQSDSTINSTDTVDLPIFSSFHPIIKQLMNCMDVLQQSQSLLNNPKLLQDVSYLLVTFFELNSNNESLSVIEIIFNALWSSDFTQTENYIQVLLILFEKGDDRLHQAFGCCLVNLIKLHCHKDSSNSLQLKSLQLLYLILRTMNWIQISEDSLKYNSVSLKKQIKVLVEIFSMHLSNNNLPHSFTILKIIDEIFKDQPVLLNLIGVPLLSKITNLYTNCLEIYLMQEVFYDKEDKEDLEDMDKHFQYVLEEDQHYSNLIQAILIKYIDIIQSITFSNDKWLNKYIFNGAYFLVYSFHSLSMMTNEDVYIWKEEPNQYIQDEEDETNQYSIKQACLSCLYSLIERFPEQFTKCIFEIVNHFTNIFFESISYLKSINKLNCENLSKLSLQTLNGDEISNLVQIAKIKNQNIIKNILDYFLEFGIGNQNLFDCFINPQMKWLLNGEANTSSNLISLIWKKMESSLFVLVTFVKDLMSYTESSDNKLHHYATMCIQIMQMKTSEIILGRAIWAMSTLKHFVTDDNEFIEIYKLISEFLKPDKHISVRLCASRSITKMSFKIANENKQELIGSQIGENFRNIHVWVLDLLVLCDDKTTHLIIDNLISFYDICPGLLSQEINSEICEQLLKLMSQHKENSILLSSFLQLFKKFLNHPNSANAFLPLYIEFLKYNIHQVLNQNYANLFDFEKNIEDIGIYFDLLSNYSTQLSLTLNFQLKKQTQ